MISATASALSGFVEVKSRNVFQFCECRLLRRRRYSRLSSLSSAIRFVSFACSVLVRALRSILVSKRLRYAAWCRSCDLCLERDGVRRCLCNVSSIWLVHAEYVSSRDVGVSGIVGSSPVGKACSN